MGDWELYAQLPNLTSTAFTDYMAGMNTNYQYKVTVFKAVAGDVAIESNPSDVNTAVISDDMWYVIGADGDPSHMFELPVTVETHTEPIQQEVFEPLGSNRKTIVRGKVLGAEGTMTCLWTDSQRVLAMTQIDYIKNNAGPHILKSPFGDVWRVEFAGPAKTYQPGGAISVDLAWTEVQ